MSKVVSTQDATEVAVAFLKPYWAYIRPLRAKLREGVWRVEIDVGARYERSGWVKVDSETGKVIQVASTS